MGNFSFTPLPGQFRFGKERNENFSTGCANNESSPSFSTGESYHQSEPVLCSKAERNSIGASSVQIWAGKKTEIVLLGFRPISQHVPQNRRLIKALLGRSFPVTSRTISWGRFSVGLKKKILQSTLPVGFGAKTGRPTKTGD